MQAGAMNNPIMLQSATRTADSYNQMIETWADTKTVFAQIVTTGGGEFYAAQKVNAQTSAVFHVRYDPAINVQMRIKYGTRIFAILAVNDVDGRHEEMQISAKEVV